MEKEEKKTNSWIIIGIVIGVIFLIFIIMPILIIIYSAYSDLTNSGPDPSIIQQAIDEKNLDLCNKLDDKYGNWAGVSDKQICLYDLAIETKDYKNCDWLEKYQTDTKNRDNCLNDIAIEINNPESCNLISIDGIKKGCLRVVSPEIFYESDRNLSLCYSSDPNQNQLDSCIADVAIKKNDVSICLNLSLEKFKINCIHEIARNNRNFSMCNLILKSNLSKERFDNCEMGILYVLSDENYIKLTDLTYYKNPDFIKLINICKNISLITDRDICYILFSGFPCFEKKQCDNINNTMIKKDCYKDYFYFPKEHFETNIYPNVSINIACDNNENIKYNMLDHIWSIKTIFNLIQTLL